MPCAGGTVPAMHRSPSLRSLAIVPAAAVGGLLLSATPVLAHTGHPTSGIGEGFLHPITGPDHLLAMVAVGVVAASLARGVRAWVAPAAFLAGMVIGGLAGMAGVPFPGAEALIVASVVLLGLTIAGAVEARGRALGALLALLAFAGMAHGHAHGAAAPASVNPLAYVAGFLGATAALHAAGVGVGVIIRDRRTVRFGLGLATVTAGALLVV